MKNWEYGEKFEDAPVRSCLHPSDALPVCRHSLRHLHQIEYLGSAVNHNPLLKSFLKTLYPQNYKIWNYIPKNVKLYIFLPPVVFST